MTATCSSSPGCPARCGRSSTCSRSPTSCARGVGLVVLKQHIDTTTPTGRLVFHILGAIDEFQRELIIEGTREGLDAARARGRTGGRKPKMTPELTGKAQRMYDAKTFTMAEIAASCGVTPMTVYRNIRVRPADQQVSHIR